MSVLKANCPNCAGPIEFKAGSTIVVVCPFCRSAVARTDRKLEDLGRVAEIVQSKSPLELGLRGDFNGNKFELTGRAQIKHGAGGFWDEWYATFSNGWVGWLAEAQGKFYMTFYKPTPDDFQIPSFDEIQPGQRLDGLSDETHLIVNEKGTATYVAADGEIPYQLNPNEQSNYADLVGRDGVFATIDYSTDPPYLFYGQELTLKDMGLADRRSAEREAGVAPTDAMGCPNCGGALELRAPDKSERVTCPFCNSLLNINEGNLEYLKTLKKNPSPQDFLLPIGARGSFENFADGTELEIIGAMARSVTYDGRKYFWDEYLLYNPQVGFKWLVYSEKHWNFVESVSAAEVEGVKKFGSDTRLRAGNVRFGDNSFDRFASAEARVEYVKGEFYWRVEQGEKVLTTDYVSPPLMLSKEQTEKEVNWSVGTYVEPKEIEQVFRVNDLPNPLTVGPGQPFKYNSLIRRSLLILIVFIVVVYTFSVLKSSKESDKPVYGQVIEKTYGLEALESADSTITFYSEPFRLHNDTTQTLFINSRLNYETWSEFQAELLPADPEKYRNDAAKVSPIINRFSPGEKFDNSGTIWTSNTKSFDAGATGEFQIKVTGKWKEWQKTLLVELTVYQYSKTRQSNFSMTVFLLLLIFILIPFILIFYRYSFEQRRWSDADFPGPSRLVTIISDIVSGK